ncbi:MAG TPA: mechanosensitive ion channel domain-containing protein [Stellaceae bacterium]
MTRSRIFGACALVACVLLSLAGPTRAQSQPVAPAPAAAAPAPVSADELQRLVGTLQDDAARAKLVEQLRALIAAQRGIEQKQAEENPVALLNNFSAQVDAISGEILAAAAVVLDAPRLVAWLGDQAGDARAREFWLEVGLKLGIIFGGALLAEWFVRVLLRRPAARLAQRSSGTVTAQTAQALLLLIQLFIEVLPILVFAGAAYVVLPLVQPRFSTARVAEVIIHASLTARLILAVAHVALLSPGVAILHVLSEETRNYLYIWARRFTNWAVYGFAVAAAGWWLGVPGAIYALLLRGTMLVLGILAVIFVLQNRAAVADALRGKGAANSTLPQRGHGWRLLRQRLADTWHVLAIIYIVGTFGSYVLRIEGGPVFVLRATLLSIVVLIAAGLIVRFVRRLSQRGFAVSSDLKSRFPTLELRANRYLPVLTVAASTIVYFFTVLTLLQAWGVDAFAWFTTNFGRRFTGSLLSIVTVLLSALILWEAFGSAIERYLNSIGADGRPVARSARARTLLPLLRTAVLIVLITIVALMVLSELGVNIAPLLAGAGVVGLAIGFGSQALVKDVITGLFILLEDTLAVGEVVDVGKNHIGQVEAISIRTIKLRDMSGTVHTVPFSEVSTVRNMTRDYSYFVADVGVLYREDPDRVVAVLRDVAGELAKDPAWTPFIVEPLEVVGVDRFTDSAVVIRVRLKTLPLKQWPVGREFNRRMKKAFDAQGIEMPAANQTHYLPDGEPGGAGATHGPEPVTVAK